MGKHVIDAADGPGFLVNRCNRPFSLEALRIVQERLATPEQVDRICRLRGGFRMGPFELMDLVGIDVGHAVAALVLRAVVRRAALAPVAAGRADGRERAARPQVRPRLVRATRRAGRPTRRRPQPGGGDGLVVVAGECELAGAAARRRPRRPAGTPPTPGDAEGAVPALIVDCGATEDDPPLQGGPQLLLCDAAPLAAQDPGGAAAGFFTSRRCSTAASSS